MHTSWAGSAANGAGLIVVGARWACLTARGLEVVKIARVALDGEFGAIVRIRGVAIEGHLRQQDGRAAAVDSSSAL